MELVAAASDTVFLSLHGNQGSDFSDHTLGLWWRQPETARPPAMPGTANALSHVVKLANTCFILPVCKALITRLVFTKWSWCMLKYYGQDFVFNAER